MTPLYKKLLFVFAYATVILLSSSLGNYLSISASAKQQAPATIYVKAPI